MVDSDIAQAVLASLEIALPLHQPKVCRDMPTMDEQVDNKDCGRYPPMDCQVTSCPLYTLGMQDHFNSSTYGMQLTE